MSDPFDFLICQNETNEPLVGSLNRRCSKCGCGIWVSLSGQNALRTYPLMETICEECMDKLASQDSKFHSINDPESVVARVIENQHRQN